MRADYHFMKDEANFAIIDKGVIRYQVFGKIKPDEGIRIINIVLSLLKESQ